MADISTIIRGSSVSGGVFVLYATDISAYTFQNIPQTAKFATTSSASGPIITALRNAGFTVSQAAGSPEYPRYSSGLSAGSLGPGGTGISTGTPLLYWQAQ
jgi:hypothetical protein